MTAARDAHVQQPRELTREEGMALLDEAARRYLGLTGEEFLRAWDAGEIDADDPKTHTAVMWVESLIGFAR